MGLIIEDGKGSGRSVGVSSENRMLTEAVTFSGEHHANHHDGSAYNVIFSQSPTAADDCIFYLENTSDDDLCIEGITIAATDVTADDSVYFKLGDTGTRNSATSLTPVNLNILKIK